jgi:cytochrome bd ubiquinol oxidase subunit I
VLFDWLTPRVVVWIFAQLHLLFAAFVLAVPMFALVVEILGCLSDDEAARKRYDNLAREFVGLLATSFSATAILGAIFTFAVLSWYPNVLSYMARVFGPTMFAYACVFFAESFTLYLWHYGWPMLQGRTRRPGWQVLWLAATAAGVVTIATWGQWATFAVAGLLFVALAGVASWRTSDKGLHLFLGAMLNGWGVVILFVANAWTSFMMSPAGVAADGTVLDRVAAFTNPLWMPLNIHRLVANLCFGGSIAAAFAAMRFLGAKTDAQRAHYDWMGYTGNLVAIIALLGLPFAGYWYGLEIYRYNQQLGVTMMGGIFSWLFIVQAVLIGAIFLAAVYYLWLGMDRMAGAERYRGWSRWLLGVIAVCFCVWATPMNPVTTTAERAAMGGASHGVLSILGVMSAKNTAVNFMILATFLTFVLYRRGNKRPTVAWAGWGVAAQVAILAAVSAVVLFIGIRGYVDILGFAAYTTEQRVSASPYQVGAVGVGMVAVLAIDVALLRGAEVLGPIRWGHVPRRGQVALLFMAVSFTWLMGLMGFVRSGLRQHWHVYEVMKDTTPDAFTPPIGFASNVITAVTLIFFALVALVGWISGLAGHGPEVDEAPVEPGPG